MAVDPGDEIVIRAALRDEMSRPIGEIRTELGQLRLALNAVQADGRRAADALERMEAAAIAAAAAARADAAANRVAAAQARRRAEAARTAREAVRAQAEAERAAAAAAAANAAAVRAAARAVRNGARALSDYARQAGQATRATARLTGAVLGLNAALRGGKGLVGSIAGVRGSMKALILLFATLIPAAVPVFSVLTGSILSTGGTVGVLVGSLGVLVLALSGVGDAVGALASGDLDKINESFAKLTDTGREFATYIVSLRPVLDQLRGAAQVATLPGLQAALGILVTTLPAVTDLVVALGQATGNAAIQFADAFAGPGGQAFVQFLIAQAPSLNQFVSGIISLTGSLSLLLQAFSPLAAVTNAALGGVLDNFRAFSDGTTGRLQQFIGYIEQAMGPVGQFLTGFGTTLLDLLEALGQPGLVVLGAVNDLLGLLSTLAPLVGDIAQAIGIGLAGVFQSLIPIVEQLAPVLGQVLIQATQGFAAALIALAPVIGQIATFIGDELLIGVQALIPFIEPLGSAFLGVLQAILPLVPILLSLIPIVGQTLLSVFSALTPAIAELAPVVGQVAADLVTGLLPVLPQLADLLAQVLDRVVPLLPIIGDQLVTAFALVIPQLPQLITSFLQLVDVLVPLLPQITQIAVDLLPILVGGLQVAIPLVTDIARVFRDSLLPVLSVVADLFDRLAGFFSDSANLTALGETAKLIAGIFTAPLDDPLKGVKNLFGSFSDDYDSNPRRSAGGTFGDTGVPIAPTLVGSGAGGNAAPMGAVGGALGGTLAMHSALAGGSSIQVTNMLTGGGGRGRGSGDHQAGRALDLIGPGLSGYAAKLTAMGGYAAFHGAGATRHLHAVYPPAYRAAATSRASVSTRPLPAMARVSGAYGDTASSMANAVAAQMGAGLAGPIQVSVPVYVTNPTNNVDVAGAVEAGVRTALDSIRRELAERRSPNAF